MPRRALLALLVLVAPEANASLPSPTPCTVHGKMVGAANVWSAPEGHQLLLRLHGTSRWLDVSGFSPGARRVRVHSGTDTPSLLVDGWADWADVPIAVKQDVVITAPVLTLRASVPLRLIETGTSLLATPLKPTFRDVHARVACDDLEYATETDAKQPKGGLERGLANHRLDLWASPVGPQLLSLEALQFPSVLAYETQGEFVHVRFVEDVVIDGWTKKETLVEPQGQLGEMLGLLGASGWGSSGGYQYAVRDTDVRLGPRETATRVGTLEKGARVVSWGTGKANANGWIEVRIYDADAEEPPGKAFFVKSADLGAKP